jgi:hypothetical protein
MKGKIASLLAMSAALGTFDDRGNVHTYKAWDGDNVSGSTLDKAQAKREAREKRVSDRMFKGSPEHKFNLFGRSRWNGQRYLKSYQV